MTMQTPFLVPENPAAARSWLLSHLARSECEAGFACDEEPGHLLVWQGLAYRPVAASASMGRYQQAYLAGAGHLVHDLTLVLKSDGKPVGLWPLSLSQHQGVARLSAFGAPVGGPLFIQGLSERTVKKICSRTLQALRTAGAELGLGSVLCEQIVIPPSLPEGCSEWHQQLMSSGSALSTRHDLFADLGSDIATIRASFRKSFRPLINVALRTWQSDVMTSANASPEVWAAFKQLHLDVAGRSTRSDETWDLQWRMVQDGEAFLATLRSPDDQRLVGAGLFQFTADEGLYAVGAYDRSLFDKPLGHAVQQRAIETMKSLGVRWYQIGERHFPQAPHRPTDKEVAISEFKQGFASQLFCRHQFVLAVQDGSRDQT